MSTMMFSIIGWLHFQLVTRGDVDMGDTEAEERDEDEDQVLHGVFLGTGL
jgi:hypothetical protein